MKYIVVYLIRGEAGRFHRRLSRLLSKRFKFPCVADYVPPHLTLKYFGGKFGSKEEIKKVEDSVKKICSDNHRTKLKLSGFGRFGDEVVFIDAKPSREMKKVFYDFVDKLKGIKGLPWNEFDGKNMKFHATLGSEYKKEQFAKVWGYLQSLKSPSFDIYFDNITILKKPKDKWIVYKEFKFLHSKT